MNILFSVLSAAYIAGILLLADSPVVFDITAFNPYSLLQVNQTYLIRQII